MTEAILSYLLEGLSDLSGKSKFRIRTGLSACIKAYRSGREDLAAMPLTFVSRGTSAVGWPFLSFRFLASWSVGVNAFLVGYLRWFSAMIQLNSPIRIGSIIIERLTYNMSLLFGCLYRFPSMLLFSDWSSVLISSGAWSFKGVSKSLAASIETMFSTALSGKILAAML